MQEECVCLEANNGASLKRKGCVLTDCEDL
jgi:hypothetical protein